MRKVLPEKLEAGRVFRGRYATRPYCGTYGAFHVLGPKNVELKILASASCAASSSDWEHVSVSLRQRPPNWAEMCFVKDLFWEEHEVVVQYHPTKLDYVNLHPHCLHLWRHKILAFPMPPPILVGPR